MAIDMLLIPVFFFELKATFSPTARKKSRHGWVEGVSRHVAKRLATKLGTAWEYKMSVGIWALIHFYEIRGLLLEAQAYSDLQHL
jgi:hypothetical protein